MFWAANANVKIALRIHKKCHFSHSFEQASRYAPKFKMADAWPSSHTVDAAVILTEGLSQERSHCGINRQSSVSTDNTTTIPPGNKHLHRVITWVAFKPWNSLRSSYATAHAQSQYPLQFHDRKQTPKTFLVGLENTGGENCCELFFLFLLFYFNL